MRVFQVATATLAFLSMNSAMAEERIQILSDWGNVTAELADNAAARSLLQMLPVTIDMHDHLRQEKTGNLPSPLPEIGRQRDWGFGCYRNPGFRSRNAWPLGGRSFCYILQQWRVPQPGIIILGKVTGDVSIFDRPGSIAIRIEHVRQ